MRDALSATRYDRAWSFCRSCPITRPWTTAHRSARPRRWSSPLPTAAQSIPAAFLAHAAVSLATLRRAEDAFVDELFAAAPSLGIPFLAARFPRSYVDANREPYELDPGMFEGRCRASSTTAPRGWPPGSA